MLIINRNLMKAKITTTLTKIFASVFSMCTNLARHLSQLLWQQYICFPQYPSLIIYTQGKKKPSWRDGTTGAISADPPASEWGWIRMQPLNPCLQPSPTRGKVRSPHSLGTFGLFPHFQDKSRVTPSRRDQAPWREG